MFGGNVLIIPVINDDGWITLAGSFFIDDYNYWSMARIELTPDISINKTLVDKPIKSGNKLIFPLLPIWTPYKSLVINAYCCVRNCPPSLGVRDGLTRPQLNSWLLYILIWEVLPVLLHLLKSYLHLGNLNNLVSNMFYFLSYKWAQLLKLLTIKIVLLT